MSVEVFVAMDAGRARVFTIEPVADPEFESGPNLVECEDWVNPERELRGKDAFSNLKSGRNRAPGGPAHGYDDGRDEHQRELERRFARDVVDKLVDFVATRGALRITVAGTARMLGLVRPMLAEGFHDRVRVVDFEDDLTQRSVPQMEAALVKRGVLPERKTPPHVYRPSGQ